MAKTKQKVKEIEVKPIVTPRFDRLIFSNYKPLPKFKSGCINCD